RRVIHYGFKYDYRSKSKTLERIDPPPKYLTQLTEKIWENEYWTRCPNQIIVNHYEPGQGIAAHTDHVKYFSKEISTLSLGHGVIMTFKKNTEKIDILLPVGSLLVLSGEAR